MANNKRLVILSFLVILLAVFTVFWKPNKKAETAVPVVSDVQVIVLQKEGSAQVYLNGKDASLVSVFETALNYDNKNIEIKSATPGGFFVQPLILASDIKSGQFSFAFNPGLNIPRSDAISTNLPVLSIKFSAKGSSDKAVIGLNPDATRVYLFDEGVFSPDISLFRE